MVADDLRGFKSIDRLTICVILLELFCGSTPTTSSKMAQAIVSHQRLASNSNNNNNNTILSMLIIGSRLISKNGVVRFNCGNGNSNNKNSGSSHLRESCKTENFRNRCRQQGTPKMHGAL